MEINIEPFSQELLLPLQKLAIQTFEESYPEERERGVYIELHYTLAALTKDLEMKNNGYFLAKIGTECVAFMKLIALRSPDFLSGINMEIARIYVLKAYHGQHIGKQLLAIAEREAKAIHAENLWLLVWEENRSAQRFYEKNGFTLEGTIPFLYGDRWEDDWVYVKTL